MMADASGNNCDVIIGFIEGDREFRDLLRQELTDLGLSVYDDESAEVDRGQALLEAKVLVTVLSPESVLDKSIQDEVALAYISSTPIFPVSRYSFEDINVHLDFGLRLTVAKLNWVFFRSSEETKENLIVLSNSIKAELPNVQKTVEGLSVETEGGTESVGYTRTRRPSDSGTPDFWVANFPDTESVPYSRFEEAFTAQYRDQLEQEFGADRVGWLLRLLRVDVFDRLPTVTAEMYKEFCGAQVSGNRFYSRLKGYAIGMQAMKQVFDMESTVRLAAVTNLGEFKTSAVIQLLGELLDDEDPNMRAVACVALSRADTDNPKVLEKMLGQLGDEDRLAREAAVLSLGKLRYDPAIPVIIEIWRNDPIKPVREAAERALGFVGGEATSQSMRMVTLLQDEIKNLKNMKDT